MHDTIRFLRDVSAYIYDFLHILNFFGMSRAGVHPSTAFYAELVLFFNLEKDEFGADPLDGGRGRDYAPAFVFQV